MPKLIPEGDLAQQCDHHRGEVQSVNQQNFKICHLSQMPRNWQMSATFCECKSPDPRGPIVLSSYCLHQVRVCLSLSRLTNDVKIKQRCEELAMNFAARIGGKDDFDILELRSDQQANL